MRQGRQRFSRRTLGAGAGVVVLALLAVAPAFACSGNRGIITTNPARADAGATIDVNGSSFQPAPDLLVKVRWGGPSGLLLATVAPDENGTFSTRITVPAGAETGFHQISATQRQPTETAPETYFSATFAIEVQGAPAPVPTPSQQSSPAPSAPQASQPAPAPTAQAAPAPTAATAPATTRAPVKTAAPPAAAVATQAPATTTPAAPEPAPVAAAPVGPPPTPTAVDPIPALPTRDSLVMGGPRTVNIDSGAPLWLLVPLVGVSLTLFAASCAAIVSDVRQRRTKAKVSA